MSTAQNQIRDGVRRIYQRFESGDIPKKKPQPSGLMGKKKESALTDEEVTLHYMGVVRDIWRNKNG